MGLLLCLLSLVATFAATRRRLGLGLQVLLAVGYAYGILRANFPDGFSHFIFDAALLGLYVAYFGKRPSVSEAVRGRYAVFWLKALAVTPLLLFFVPLQHPLVQLVGLRAAILFLPVLVLGARLETGDLGRVARWVSLLNVLAFGFAAAEYVFGVDRFYPKNALTELIYVSGDVGEAHTLRIPSIFTSAHAYGATMLATLPMLLARWNSIERRSRERWLALAAMGTTVIGIFMCGARSPVVLLFALAVAALLGADFPVRRKLALASLAGLVVLVVSTSDRFQRFATLRDTEYVEERISGSANLTILDTALEYPLGAGLARAFGTSIPFFLRDLAKPPIGLENEFARIALEQGLVGLAVWVAFIVRTVGRRPSRLVPGWRLGYRMIRVYVFLMWCTALIGTGMLTSIPTTVVLLLYMGVLLAGLSPRLAHPGRVAVASSAS